MRYALTNLTFIDLEADTLVIKDGFIEEVGWESKLTDKLRGVRKVDMEGATCLPSLHESHSHIYLESKNHLDVRGVRSIGELVERIKSVIKSRKLKYLVVRGWDHEMFKERSLPERTHLDEASPSVPVIAIRFCGHVAVANTAMLKVLRDELEGLEGFVDFKTGLITEEGIQRVLSTLPRPEPQQLLKSLEKLINSYVSFGVTSINFVNVDSWSWDLLKEFEAISPTARWVKIGVYSKLGDYEFIKRSGGSPNLRLCGIKLFSDGSLGGRTAFLSESYEDSPGTRGVFTLNEGELRRAWEFVRDDGRELAIHAIGDEALRRVLRFLGKLGVPGSRVRIEHASVTPPDVLTGLRELRPKVVVQPHFLVSDWWAHQRLGPRVTYLYMFKTLIKLGLEVYGSSDYPVEPLNPFLSISAAMTRASLSKYSSNEALTLSEALKLYFKDPCFGITEIAAGRPADLVVINEDLRRLSGYDIASVRPSLTLSHGHLLYVDKNLPGKILRFLEDSIHV